MTRYARRFCPGACPRARGFARAGRSPGAWACLDRPWSALFSSRSRKAFWKLRRGAGSFVASALPESLPLTPADPADGAQTMGQHGSRLSRRGEGLAACANRPTPGTSPVSPNQPAYEEFPFSKWSRLWSRCWRRPAMDMLNYGDPLGYDPLGQGPACSWPAAQQPGSPARR